VSPPSLCSCHEGGNRMTTDIPIRIGTGAQTLPSDLRGVGMAWLEITPSCQLQCKHCYVSSRPGLGHGRMSYKDWTRVLDQLKALECRVVQFIGGEPTIHPRFVELVEHAAGLGFTVEVYSNLTGITDRMWAIFQARGVKLATSFYSDRASVHDEITSTPGSFSKTLANITRALELGLEVRAGLVEMQDGQRAGRGRALLEALGVPAERIKVDRIRGVGRGDAIKPEDPVRALCGQCAKGKVAVTASGDVYPCVFARTFQVGNVLKTPLEGIVHGPAVAGTRLQLAEAFTTRRAPKYRSPDPEPCDPDACVPEWCNPDDELCTPDTCDPADYGQAVALQQRGCDPETCDPDACGPQWCGPDESCDPNNPEPCYPSCTPCLPDVN
jgi:uncharacterized Fe-S cluster-containing radical SAM superfamily protein